MIRHESVAVRPGIAPVTCAVISTGMVRRTMEWRYLSRAEQGPKHCTGKISPLRGCAAPVEMTDGGSGCHEMSCSVTIRRHAPCSLTGAAPSSPFPCAAVRNRQTILSTMFFCTSASLSEAAPPARTAANRPPKTQFCSYNVPMRMSSAFRRHFRSGSGVERPLRKGKGRAAGPSFALSGFRGAIGFSGGNDDAGARLRIGKRESISGVIPFFHE